MIIAVAAVYAAIAVTLYVNGSYAWSKGGSPSDQMAMLGLALAIDGCKCSFLRLASLRQQEGRTLAAVLLFVLWWPCLVYSTFAGYSYLHTNRAAVSTGKQGTADERQRAQATHDQAAADLRLALANPLWAPTDANPEVTGIAANTGFAAERIQLIIALVPAILVELLASVGFYAIGTRPAEKAPGKSVEARRQFWLPELGSTRKTPPAASAGASGAVAKPVPAAVVADPAIVPTMKWKIPS
jgi:hypothetical protein